MPRDTFDGLGWGVGDRRRTLLNIPQCKPRPPTTKNYLASNINSDDAEKLCPTLNKRKSKLSSEQTRAFLSTFPASLHSAALYLKQYRHMKMKLSFQSLKITAVGKRLRLKKKKKKNLLLHQGFTEMGLDIINRKRKKKQKPKHSSLHTIPSEEFLNVLTF